MIADPVLILVDFQKDFCKPGYRYLTEEEPAIQSAIESAGEFLTRYRNSGRTPIIVRTIHDIHSTSSVWMEKYENDKAKIPCKPDTEGAEIVPELNIKNSDVTITKNRYSGFYNTNLDTILSSNEAVDLLIGGVNTEICVASTVHDAFNRDYKVTVLSDCTSTSSQEQHEICLENINSNFGTVSSSSDIELSPIDDPKSQTR